MSLNQKIKTLIEEYGYHAVLNAIEDLVARRVSETNKCLKTGKPLPHEFFCAYCKQNCLLAGQRIKRKMS